MGKTHNPVPGSLSEEFSTGYLFGELLHKYGLQDDFNQFSQSRLVLVESMFLTEIRQNIYFFFRKKSLLFVIEVWGSALGLSEVHTSGLSPSVSLSSLPSGRSVLPSTLVSSAKLLRVHSIPSSISSIKILNRSDPNTDPWGTLFVISHQLV